MADDKQPTVEYTLTLRAIGSDPPAIIRMRQLLKVALRSFNMRCMSIREVAMGEQPANEGTEGNP